jgi:two-component system, OmpR family, sensor histidine kinase KdpD
MDLPNHTERFTSSQTLLSTMGLRMVRFTSSLALIAAMAFVFYHLLPVNALTVGFSYLVAILVLATAWGAAEAIIASLFAVACLNYFFMQPIGTFTIVDPQNWVALLAFLATSIVASQLSARAKRQTQEAMDRQQDLERLYALSRAILMTDPDQPSTKQIANQIARVFDFRGVVLFDRSAGEIYRAGPEDIADIEEMLRESALQGTQFREENRQITVTAIRLGGEPIGSLGICGTVLPDTALQALCNLVAGGLVKLRAQQAASQADAARQSQEFRSTLLDAIAHEFNTPLASIKTATSSILTGIVESPEDWKDLLSVVDEEADRLKRFVSDALQLARVDAGRVQLNLEPHSIDQIVQVLCEEMRPITEGRLMAVNVSSNLPPVMIDGVLMKLAIRQLADNALKYSSPPAPVEISARAEDNELAVTVGDRGHGIPDTERSKIFEKFYRLPADRLRVPGTGMGLAIARQIVEAHGGHMSVESRDGGGSIFSIFIPFKREVEVPA